MKRLYYVCQTELNTYGLCKPKTYWEAARIIDNLSCEALSPIYRIEANNKREAIAIAKEKKEQARV
jgi:hypothetical protein